MFIFNHRSEICVVGAVKLQEVHMMPCGICPSGKVRPRHTISSSTWVLQAEAVGRLAQGTSELANSDGRSQAAAALLEAAEQERDTAKQQLAKCVLRSASLPLLLQSTQLRVCNASFGMSRTCRGMAVAEITT